MDSQQIAELWRTSFTDVSPPTGHLCRDVLHRRWLRIHSLPGSKRYAENEEERAEVLKRHNDAATWVLGDAGPCVLFITRYQPVLEKELRRMLPTTPEFSLISELRNVEADEEDQVFVFATQLKWKRDAFDSLISAVADDATGPVLFANLWRRTAYAPYDGGADVFLESPSAVADAKTIWRSWLSSREDGM